MEVSYQHANPHQGRESYLVRFSEPVHDQTTCVLVDAGEGVDVDDLLGEDEYLSAVLLTHAHLDHFQTLGANLRDGAPIYATPETIRAIETRLDTAGGHVTIESPDEVRDALQPVSDWTTITSDVRLHPVPAGHAPGACGFVVEFADGDDRYHLLATGDFTTRRGAGYPGLPTDLDVDAVFLTAATDATVRDQLTGSVATVVERAVAGSTVLATASGSTGVHLAYLLAHVGETGCPSVPVTVAGRVATLWEAFGYDHPAVDAVPTFEDPGDVLAPGGVAIAGPEVPVAGSSQRLFDAIADDGSATLVQVTSGAFEPEESGRCTVDDYRLSNHPDESTIDAVVEELAPVHVVVTHQQGRAADRYKDKYDSFVWATDDYRRYTLYDDGGWSGPPWVTDATRRRVRASQRRARVGGAGGALAAAEVSLPAVERADSADLDAEGVDVERLRTALRVDAATEPESTPEVAPSAPPAAESDGGHAEPDAAPVAGDAAARDRNGSPTASADDGRVERAPTGVEHDGTGAADDGTGAAGDGTGAADDGTGAADVEAGRRADGATLADLDDETRWSELDERLDRIEAAVARPRHAATVVDVGDGVVLLRLDDDSLGAQLDHGETVALSVHPGRSGTGGGDATDPADDGDSEADSG